MSKPRYSTLVKALAEITHAYGQHCLADADSDWRKLLSPVYDRAERVLKRAVGGGEKTPRTKARAKTENDGTQRRREENAPLATETQSRRSSTTTTKYENENNRPNRSGL